jgi:hypothetical protein
VTSGLGLEAGLADALAAATDDGVPILELGPALDPRRSVEVNRRRPIRTGGSTRSGPPVRWS